MQSSNRTTPTIVGALAIAAIVGVGGIIYTAGSSVTPTATNSSQSTAQTTSSSQNTTAQTQTVAEAPVTATTNPYKDGTYSASSNYSVPGGRNSIKVNVTIVNGDITDVKTSNKYRDSDSAYYTDSFDSNINAAVKGDALGDAYAGRVGGASLTSSAFNDALQTIINDAKV